MGLNVVTRYQITRLNIISLKLLIEKSHFEPVTIAVTVNNGNARLPGSRIMLKLNSISQWLKRRKMLSWYFQQWPGLMARCMGKEHLLKR